MILVSLDPGKDWATAQFSSGFRDSRPTRLDWAGFQRTPHVDDFCVDKLVVEFPVVRPNGEASPNTIVRLAWRAAMIASQIIGGDQSKVAEVPTVSQPKSIIRKWVRAELSWSELAALDECLLAVPEGKHHNVYDAVRHGLVYLKRMAP